MYIVTAAVTALALAAIAQAAAPRTKVCPLLGPSFPRPFDLNSSKVFRDAMNALNHTIDVALRNGTADFPRGSLNNQTFSLSLFSTHDQGLLYQRHHTDSSVATSPVGTHSVDADTVYRIGSVSKLLTMYILLIADGDRRLNDPVSKYIPELAGSETLPYGVLPKWDQITVGDLASHLAGIVSDYGLDDIEYGYPTKGLPPLPHHRIPTCNYQIGPKIFTCTKEEILAGVKSQPALRADASTPSYSNLGYDLVGLIVEKITGVTMAQSFEENLVTPLGLKRTFYGVPSNKSFGAIPVNVAKSGWAQNLGPGNADGGNTVSTNDLATIGKAIMNSSLIPKSVTRRWLKPRTFTADPTGFVGAPWEIYRWDTPRRVYDIYTKEGGEGQYSTMFGIIPDLDLGFTVLVTGADYRPGIEERLANVIAETTLPAAEESAGDQARRSYGGRYESKDINSSVVIVTDGQPGLQIVEWIINGTNLLNELAGNGDSRLWPNDLYQGNEVGFTASFGALLPPPHEKNFRPMKLNCLTWVDTGFTQYGNVAVGSFVFDLDPDTRLATRLKLTALETVLERIE